MIINKTKQKQETKNKKQENQKFEYNKCFTFTLLSCNRNSLSLSGCLVVCFYCSSLTNAIIILYK